MSSLWWSALLTPFGLFGMYISGKKNRNGWLLGCFTQVLWISYAVDTHGYFFVLGSTGYLVMYIRNFLIGKKSPETDRLEAYLKEHTDMYSEAEINQLMRVVRGES